MKQVRRCITMMHVSNLGVGCRDKGVLEASLRRSGGASLWPSRYVLLASNT